MIFFGKYIRANYKHKHLNDEYMVISLWGYNKTKHKEALKFYNDIIKYVEKIVYHTSCFILKVKWTGLYIFSTNDDNLKIQECMDKNEEWRFVDTGYLTDQITRYFGQNIIKIKHILE